MRVGCKEAKKQSCDGGCRGAEELVQGERGEVSVYSSVFRSAMAESRVERLDGSIERAEEVRKGMKKKKGWEPTKRKGASKTRPKNVGGKNGRQNTQRHITHAHIRTIQHREQHQLHMIQQLQPPPPTLPLLLPP
jgi:hypothetical protein